MRVLVDRAHAMIFRLSFDEQPDQDPLSVHPLQKQEAVDLCLLEGLPCNVVAQRLGLPSSSLARWARQSHF